ncbi:pancreatic triacylglycerol lipase-like isoform X2 [Tachysurus fulvidraco]|nr:pancreatic triacylglycerol lipase-like isoform X2 [Tachysurus fulvidraco]XP_026997672.1 pancreatic triacylglycerol lipase-like isoform X2 [Tachysurus fulvidraco]XP_026997673.1 pancreatic triacylglycerol lipase-like isoform X2 [Tachysurus fulvidraco]XP_026997674.1 pancreatic triacylglycerol lipase-like isoform X2 [Tachysurus fulvidraco]
MWLLWISGLLHCLVGAVNGAEVCYDKLGCFSDEKPWSGTTERPIPCLPWSPEKINARFILFTRENPNSFQEISTNADVIAASKYQATRKTRFITHGFVDKGDENWLFDMCKLMLSIEDINCICVDWKSGSRSLYTQAANNIRVIGAQIAYMISIFKENFQQDPESVHIIGHSLGAHLAAEAGRRTPRLGRITGLDPAQPYFQGCPALVRLDPSDALFVDVIHTDSLPVIPYLGFGMSQAVGHLDFYPNGGESMPGCEKNAISQIVDIDGIWEGTRDFVACNHLRSYKYYTDSILNPAGFLGYPCSNQEMFESGHCFPCDSSSCPFMGYHSDKFNVTKGVDKMKFYLNTGDARPFSRYRYRVTVTIDGSRTSLGYFKVALYGVNGNTRQYEIHKGTLSPGRTYELLIDVEKEIDELTFVKFIWNNKVLNPLLPKFGATNIVVQRGRDRKMFKFCGKDWVRENVLQTLSTCQ